MTPKILNTNVRSSAPNFSASAPRYGLLIFPFVAFLYLVTFPHCLVAERFTGKEIPSWAKERNKAIVRVEYVKPAGVSYKKIFIKQLTNGVIVSEAGLILTVAHGLGEGAPRVILHTGKRMQSKIIIRNETMDIAVLKIDSDKPLAFAPMTFVNKQYDVVWTMGRNEYGSTFVSKGRTMAQGINLTGKELKLVQNTDSGKSRVKHFIALPSLFLHDAMVSEGYSGGPLFDAQGNLLGINFGRAGTKKRGISFSMSVNNFQSALDDFTMEMEMLAIELEDNEYRYQWFLDGLKNHFLSEGIDLKGAEKRIDRLTDPKFNIKNSWKKFAEIEREDRKLKKKR